MAPECTTRRKWKRLEVSMLFTFIKAALAVVGAGPEVVELVPGGFAFALPVVEDLPLTVPCLSGSRLA